MHESGRVLRRGEMLITRILISSLNCEYVCACIKYRNKLNIQLRCTCGNSPLWFVSPILDVNILYLLVDIIYMFISNHGKSVGYHFCAYVYI